MPTPRPPIRRSALAAASIALALALALAGAGRPAGAEPPAGWVEHRTAGIVVALPPEFELRDRAVGNAPDLSFERQGPGGAVTRIAIGALPGDVIAAAFADPPPGLELIEEAPVTVGGATFLVRHARGTADGEPVMGEIIHSEAPGANGWHALILIDATGEEEAAHDALVAALLGALALEGAPERIGEPAVTPMLGGMGALRVPRGMALSVYGEDGGSFEGAVRTEGKGRADLRLETGAGALASLEGLAAAFTAPPALAEGAFLGLPAWLFTGTAALPSEGEQTGALLAAVPKLCLADGLPLLAQITTSRRWNEESGGQEAALGMLTLTLPPGAGPCAPEVAAALAALGAGR